VPEVRRRTQGGYISPATNSYDHLLRVPAGPAPGARDSDQVDHPSHYTEHPSGVECITVTEHMNFCLGNAVKYIWRAGLKADNATEDLRKARWYLDREIARLECRED